MRAAAAIEVKASGEFSGISMASKPASSSAPTTGSSDISATRSPLGRPKGASRITLAPCSASERAVASPMPLEAPVMTTTFPAMFLVME